jgi:hypothetical protein
MNVYCKLQDLGRILKNLRSNILIDHSPLLLFVHIRKHSLFHFPIHYTYLGFKLGRALNPIENHHIILLAIKIGIVWILHCFKIWQIEWRNIQFANSSATPDPYFAFVGGPCCPTLDFVITCWIMITFYTLLTSYCVFRYLRFILFYFLFYRSMTFDIK